MRIKSKTYFKTADKAELVRGAYPGSFGAQDSDGIVSTQIIEGSPTRVTSSAQRIAFDSATADGSLDADFFDFLKYEIKVVSFNGLWIVADIEEAS